MRGMSSGANKVDEAMAFLERWQEGLFAGLIEHALDRGGVVHAAPDCFFVGVPTETEGVMEVLFQCSELPALRRVLCALMPKYTRVRWKREFTGRASYGERERDIADFFRHEDFGTGLTK